MGKNYQGGKKLHLNISNTSEEIYYKRIDSKKIIDETWKTVTITPDKKILRRKLFVKGDSEEQEFTYKYLTEKGEIYEGKRLKGILDLTKDSVKFFDGKRFLEFDRWGGEPDKNDYIIEEEYNIYPTNEEETNLSKLAETLFNEHKIAICEFNPNGTISGLGFVYPIADMVGNKMKYSLVIAYGRLKKNKHLIFYDRVTKSKAVKKERIRVVE